MIGNGQAGAIPFSELTDEARAERNVVYIGVPSTALPETAPTSFAWSAESFQIGNGTTEHRRDGFVHPSASGGLYGVLHATKGQERLVSLPAFRFSIQCT